MNQADMTGSNILVVDDIPENLTVLRHILTNQGYQVRPAINGNVALRAIEKTTPDLILLDIMMPPGIDGYEVCRRLKANKRTRDIPVIFISALDETIDKVKAFEMGGVDYIVKPFQAEEVLARVRTHLMLRNMQKQLQEQNNRLQQEIQERKRAENFLRKLEKAMETTEIGITITDAEGRIVYTNPADARMHGYTVEELIGQPSNIFGSPELRYHEPLGGTDAKRYSKWKRERVNLHQDGTVFPVELISNSIYNANNEFLGTVTICEDITERKQTEQELQQAKEAAEVANKAKSVFLANMSHELRTPLNAILGFAQLLFRSQHIDEEERENLNIITRSGEHLLTLINQVLDLSKIEAGKMTINLVSCDLYRLLDDVLELFRLRSEKKSLALCFERSPDLPRYIRTDDVKLRQVLINLLSNALKFTSQGSIALSVCKLKLDTPVEKLEPSLVEPHWLRFKVEDTGPGIDPGELTRLFEAFVQTSSGQSQQEGTGLGLSICQHFVHLLGGEISVQSRPDQGSTFLFDIPVTLVEKSEAPVQSKMRQIVGIKPPQFAYRILIVDDKWDNRQLLVKLLKPFGFALREAVNGEEALDIWESWEPHLIWMDVRMPVLGGYEATQRIREEESTHHATKIIAMNAGSIEHEPDIALSQGCDDFLRKPFKESDVFELMQKHLGLTLLYEEVASSPQELDNDALLHPECLKPLSTEILMELKQAIIIADLERIAVLIQQIHTQDASLAALLRHYIENFEYEKVLTAIQVQKETV